MTAVATNRIDRLIREMSLAEKLGQLTMTAAGYTVTGPTIAGDSTESISAGTVGNLLNLTGQRARARDAALWPWRSRGSASRC